jgi:adenine-specific DNA methylase
MKSKSDQTETKLRGGYYTDEEIATFLLRWVLGGGAERILEPGCGNGNFLAALRHLNTSDLNRVDAYEIDPDEASVARRRASPVEGVQTAIQVDDYVKRSALQLQNPERYDAVVGNPPFVRYQYLDDETQMYAKTIFEYYGLGFTHHVGLWVPFVVAATAQLKKGGRLAMVLPAGLLHVRHARSLRNYLVEQCSRLLVVDPKTIWFEQTLQGAVLLLAEKKQGREQSQGVSIVRAKDKEFAQQAPMTYFETSEFVKGKLLERNWMRALLSAGERRALLSAKWEYEAYRFGDIAEVFRGIVTGANNFFLVPDNTVVEYNLGEWAHPNFASSQHVPGVVYDRAVHEQNTEKGLPTNLIWFEDVSGTENLPAGPTKYVEKGKKDGFHERKKCRVRDPWFELPPVHATQLAIPRRCQHFPRLIYNKFEAFSTDTAFHITSESYPPQSLSFSFINSLTALSAEIEGRHYGGGVLELVTSEIEELLVPKPTGTEKDVYELDRMVRDDQDGAPLLMTQDENVLETIGMPREQISALHSGWRRLRGRRQRSD